VWRPPAAQAPVAVVEGTVEEGVGGALSLRPHARHAAEEGHELDVSPHGDGGQVRGRAAEAHNHVVRDGAAGRVARHEDAPSATSTSVEPSPTAPLKPMSTPTPSSSSPPGSLRRPSSPNSLVLV
jgi:hypothetical protein